jgi:excinuclease ABC subunit B
VEAQRIEQRTNYDLEMIEEVGYCNGIENYSRYLTDREEGEQPATLIDYFPDDFLMFIDESHMTIPQINGMYNGDKARKQTLVDFGFRLPSALDNRPLKFSEFEKHINKVICVSATPAAYEYRQSGVKTGKIRVGNLMKEVVDKNDLQDQIKDPASAVAQQVIRPTGLLDPSIEVKKTKNQLDDLLLEIKKTVKKKQRVLVTTLTKRLAEEISDYLKELKVKVQYLHSEIDTLERLDILRDLRLGKFDVLVGINLLREGLDLPEVSLVAILDADKEGFLRSETSLIQTMGRAARHQEGRVIMYADNLTGSMKRAIEEVKRRRKIQQAYNKEHGITPRSIEKEVGESLKFRAGDLRSKIVKTERLKDYKAIPKDEIKRIVDDLEDEMKVAAENLEFEKAAGLRDEIKKLKSLKK